MLTRANPNRLFFFQFNMMTFGTCTKKQRRGRPKNRPATRQKTDKTQRRRTTSSRPGFLRCQRRYRQRKPSAKLLLRDTTTRSQMLLRISNRHGKHTLRNLLTAHRHIRHRQTRKKQTFQRHTHDARRRQQSHLGSQLVRRGKRIFRRTIGRFRGRRRHILLSLFLRHFWLKKEDSCQLTFSNELISRRRLASSVCLLYQKYATNKPTTKNHISLQPSNLKSNSAPKRSACNSSA